MYKEIDLKNVRESKMKYRKAYDSAAMKELTESIKSHGVLEPIIVREVTAGDFEIVAGHRRHLASIEAGLEIIPAIVKELTDEAALEIQVIENSQREDPNPMEEAEGFKALLDMGKHTTETLAERIGHSTKYVLGRLKLIKLPKKAREMVASGEIGMGHALLLTRLKHSSEQKTALTVMTQHEGMTIKEAARSIKRTYCRNIKDALFDKTKCETCAYRTKNQAVLFPDLKDTDECMDKSCYLAKTKAHCQAVIDARKKEGFTVFTTEKEVESHTGYSAKGTCEIAGPGVDIEYSRIVKPRRYKSECMKCKEFHAWYMYKFTPLYADTTIEFGEICMNKSCLDKMNKVTTTGASTSSSSSSGNDPLEPGRRKDRAIACRNRFLKANIEGMFQCSPNMQIRLAIYIIADSSFRVRGALKEFHNSPHSHLYNDQMYGAIADMPDEELSHVLSNILAAAFRDLSGDVMLRMAPEAGVEISDGVVIDREWLESQSFKKKSDLLALVGELDIEVETKLPKAKLVDAILKLDLKGKVPKEITEVCKIEEDEEESAAAQAAPKVVSPWCPKCHYDESMCECSLKEVGV